MHEAAELLTGTDSSIGSDELDRSISSLFWRNDSETVELPLSCNALAMVLTRVSKEMIEMGSSSLCQHIQSTKREP